MHQFRRRRRLEVSQQFSSGSRDAIGRHSVAPCDPCSNATETPGAGLHRGQRHGLCDCARAPRHAAHLREHRRDKGPLDVTSLLGSRAQSYLPQGRPRLSPQRRSGQRPTDCHCPPAALDTARITGCQQQKVARVARASEPPGGRVPTSREAGREQTPAKARGERAERSSADVSGRVGGERLAGRRRAIHGLGRTREAGEDLTNSARILNGGDQAQTPTRLFLHPAPSESTSCGSPRSDVDMWWMMCGLRFPAFTAC